MKKAVLFDLGNTLAAYYTRAQWPEMLRAKIERVHDHLVLCGEEVPDEDQVHAAVEVENRSAPSRRVRPLEARLARIFFPDRKMPEELVDDICRAFLDSTFALARVYEDTLPTLAALRQRRVKTAIVSNSPWGSPPGPWHEHVEELGLAQAVDTVVFCGDVGYRKPAPRPFQEAMRRLGVGPADCLFVGDDPRWDLAGPQALGMDALIIDREVPPVQEGPHVITRLGEVLFHLD